MLPCNKRYTCLIETIVFVGMMEREKILGVKRKNVKICEAVCRSTSFMTLAALVLNIS